MTVHRRLDTENRDSLIALDGRVGSLEAGLSSLSKNVENRLNNLQADFDEQFHRLGEKLDKRDDRRWIWTPVIAAASLVLMAVGGLGTLSIIPLKDELNRVREVSREFEKDNNSRVRALWERTQRTQEELAYLKGQLHPLIPK